MQTSPHHDRLTGKHVYIVSINENAKSQKCIDISCKCSERLTKLLAVYSSIDTNFLHGKKLACSGKWDRIRENEKEK